MTTMKESMIRLIDEQLDRIKNGLSVEGYVLRYLRKEDLEDVRRFIKSFLEDGRIAL